jgi:hypothetical protein
LVHECYPFVEGLTVVTVKVLKSRNSRAVRLPKALRVKNREVEISRRGDDGVGGGASVVKSQTPRR